MIEQTLSLDEIFGSLADPTRRDIISRLLLGELNVGDIARHYDMSLAAISKHLQVLERACLVIKRRRGKQQMVAVSPMAIKTAEDYLKGYQALWEERFQRLDSLLMEE